MLKLRITKKKNGQTVFWFAGPQGRVRIGQPNRMNWIRAQQIRELADYGISLIRERVAKGIGSDDAPMPALSGRTSAIRRDGRFVSQRAGYRDWKSKQGLRPIRDLRGPGRDLKGGAGTHMLEDIRVTYFDDRRAQFDISKRDSRVKARANEDRAPWFGWSPSDMRKMAARFHEIFQTGLVEQMVSMGLAGSALLTSSRRWLRRAA